MTYKIVIKLIDQIFTRKMLNGSLQSQNTCLLEVQFLKITFNNLDH